MFIGFNQATTLKNSDTMTDLKYAEKCGFDYFEFQMVQLNKYLIKNPVSGIRKFFDNSRVKPFALNVLEFFNLKTENEFKVVKSEFLRMCDLAKEIGCKIIILVPSRIIKPITIMEIKKDSINVLGILAEIANEFELKLSYEFIGFSNFSVNNFLQCYEIVKEINRDNIGITLDCFHFYASGSKIDDLKKSDGKKIFAFHVNDSKDLPLNSLADSDRVWPGEGVIPLKEIFKTLKEISFDGVASIELFNPEYWTWSAKKTIEVAKRKTDEIIKKFWPNV